MISNCLFLCSFVPKTVQHPLRRENRLSSVHQHRSWRKDAELEPHQRHNLLQLLAARVLPGVAHHEDACQGAEPKNYIEAAKDLDIDQSVQFRWSLTRWWVHQRYRRCHHCWQSRCWSKCCSKPSLRGWGRAILWGRGRGTENTKSKQKVCLDLCRRGGKGSGGRCSQRRRQKAGIRMKERDRENGTSEMRVKLCNGSIESIRCAERFYFA